MSEHNWIGLAASVMAEGVKALVPGAGPLVSLAGQLLAPEVESLQRWRDNKAEQRALAKSVTRWAHDRGCGDASAELGMTSAAGILRQKGASLQEMAQLNLDPAAIADQVLFNNARSLKSLDAPSRLVCVHTVETFYARLLNSSGLQALSGVGLQEILSRTQRLEVKLSELRDEISALRAAGQRDKWAERHRDLARDVMRNISELETAESHFRWVWDTHASMQNVAVHDARLQLVEARVLLEARAKELPEPEVREQVLAYVSADELEDSTLRASADQEVRAAARSATIDAYRLAQDAVAAALRAMDQQPQ